MPSVPPARLHVHVSPGVRASPGVHSAAQRTPVTPPGADAAAQRILQLLSLGVMPAWLFPIGHMSLRGYLTT